MKLKFCKEQDVDVKFKKLLIFQTKFLTKMQHLKLKGKKVDLMTMVNDWFNDE